MSYIRRDTPWFGYAKPISSRFSTPGYGGYMSLPAETDALDDKSTEFLFAEYKALRDEILALQERAMTIQIAGLTGIPALIGAGDALHLPFLIVFGPVIVVIATLLLIFTQDSIMRDGRYIKNSLEPYFLGNSGKGWEHFLQKSGERRVERYTRIWVFAAFGFYYIGATLLACVRLAGAQLPRYLHPITLSAAIAIYAIVFIWAGYFIIGHFPRGTEPPKTE
jgi:hypothetical protein